MLQAILSPPFSAKTDRGSKTRTQATPPSTTPSSPTPSIHASFHPFPRLPTEIQLPILSYALSTAISSLFPRRHFSSRYTGHSIQTKDGFLLKTSYHALLTNTRYVEKFEIHRSEIMRLDGVGAFLGVNYLFRNETLKILEKRLVMGKEWEGVWRDRRRRNLRKWKGALYLLEIGDGEERERERERRRGWCERDLELASELKWEAYRLMFRQQGVYCAKSLR